MKNYEVSKNKTAKSVLIQVKSDFKEKLMEFLIKECGQENVKEVRTGRTTKVNEISAIVGTVLDNGESYPVCITINPVAKPYKEEKTKSKTIPAFNIYESAEEYQNYLKENEDKKEKAKQAKEKKIERDKKAREERRKKKEENKIESENALERMIRNYNKAD